MTCHDQKHTHPTNYKASGANMNNEIDVTAQAYSFLIIFCSDSAGADFSLCNILTNHLSIQMYAPRAYIMPSSKEVIHHMLPGWNWLARASLGRFGVRSRMSVEAS